MSNSITRIVQYISYERIIQAIICAGFAVAAVGPISHPDELWSLVVGRWIFHKIQVPYSDIWAATSSGLGQSQSVTWLAKGWLTQSLMGAVDYFGGFKGLAILKAISAFIFVSVVVNCSVKLTRSRFLGILIGLLTAAATLDSFQLGPEIFGLMFFALYLTLTYRLIDGVLLDERYLSLFIVSCLASNFHSSAVFFIPCALFLLLDMSIIGHARVHSPSVQKIQAIKMVVILKLCAVSLCGLVFSPYFGLHLYIFGKWALSAFTLNVLSRSSPGNIYSYSFSVCLIQIILLGSVLASAKWRPSKGEILLSTIAMIIAFSSAELCSFVSVILGIVLARAIGCAGGIHIGMLGDGLKILEARIRTLPLFGLSWLILVMTIIGLANLLREPVFNAEWPKQELDFVRTDTSTSGQNCAKLVHSSALSGYIIYGFSNLKGEPESKAFLSPDTKYYSPRFFQNVASLWSAHPSWDKVISKSNLCEESQYLLLRQIDPLYQVLIRHSEWERIKIREMQSKETYSSEVDRYGWALFRHSAQTRG